MQLTFKSKNKRGVTLLEVLVAGVILSFVLAGVVTVISLNARLSNKGIAEAFLQSNLKRISQRISTDVRNGYEVSLLGDTLKIKDKAGATTRWAYNSTTKEMMRNDIVFNAIGVDSAKFKCNFFLESSQSARIAFKLNVVKSKSFKATTGKDSISYRFSCRNSI